MTAKTASPWIKRPRSLPMARARLFCVPHGGGGPSSFARWVTGLAPDTEVCLVHLPGREGRLREEPLTDLMLIAAHVAEAMTPLLDVPFAFFGHSMGSIIAYEAALRLTEEPRHLFVSASPPPHRVQEEPPFAHLPDAEFLDGVRRSYDGIPDTVWNDEELMRIMLPSMRADFAAYETYRWQQREPLRCPITVLGGKDDPLVPDETLADWSQLTSGDCRTQLFEGGHFYVNEARPRLQQLVREALGAPVPVAKGRG
ncbi:thioesterase II family protein [Streptomyces xantholiticus]|uniref:Alpha/beta fold hydrolase n=1 Tax=Streptomyces xantholiticus TaxID=68285 RepID=A0ABV1UYR4_9ACTN|nr:alpha/beta fold hydrolase [Streptomyces xantholiticus]ATW47347.1 putative thioesterase [Streptomyces peucetius subsp. caesius ATCC 27952]GGW37581.1 thioesterase [Streptomyces xantholiticus]